MDVELSQPERERYERQLALVELDVRAQERLKLARVLVVGACAVGANAAAQLASAGVGYIGVADRAEVGLADLAAQSVHFTPDVGAGKAESVAAKLGLLNPDVQVDPYPVEVGEDNVEAIVAGHDVVVCCLSQLRARLLINDACLPAGITLVDCLAGGSRATVQVVRPGGGACLRCEAAQPQPGRLPGVAAVAAGIAAAETVKLLSGASDPVEGRLELDLADARLSVAATSRREDCPACARLAETIGGAA